MEDERISLEDTEEYLKDEIENTLVKREQVLKEELDNILEEKEFLKKKLSLIPLLKKIAEKREKGERITEKEAKIAMAITCYGNIAYCCGVRKKCPFRDAALIALGVTHDEYRKKEEYTMKMLRELRVITELP